VYLRNERRACSLAANLDGCLDGLVLSLQALPLTCMMQQQQQTGLDTLNNKAKPFREMHIVG
jgi:hypothetical protein